MKQTGADIRTKDKVSIEGSHCPKIERYANPIPASKAKRTP